MEELLTNAISLSVILSFVPLALTSVCGLILSALQAATQINEQSVIYLVKISALCLVGYLFGSALSERLLEFSAKAFSEF